MGVHASARVHVLRAFTGLVVAATLLAAGAASATAAGPPGAKPDRTAHGAHGNLRVDGKHVNALGSLSKAREIPSGHVAPHRLAQRPAQNESTGKSKQSVSLESATPSGAATPNTPSPSAPVGPAFSGIGQSESGFIPPDPTMAAGPMQIVIATNGRVKAFNKNGTLVAGSSMGLGQFFSSLSGAADGPFDPKLAFDPYANRFWFLSVSAHDSTGGGDTNRSTFLIAISDGSDVTQGWTFFQLDATLNGNSSTGNWCDYPQLGFDAQAVYFGCNMFSFPTTSGGFQYAKLRILLRSEFTGGGCCSWWDEWNFREEFLGVEASFTIQPSKMYGAVNSDGEWMVDAHTFCFLCTNHTLEVFHVTNAQNCCNGSSGPNFDQTSFDVGDFPDPTGGRQSGGLTRTDTGDIRLLYAIWQGGHLSTGQNMSHSGDSSISFTELNVSGGLGSISAVNDWQLTNSGVDYYYPQVDSNAANDKTMVFSRSGTSEFVSARFVTIPNSGVCTTCSSGENVLANGDSGYVQLDTINRNRWGDYSGAARDPDGTGIWVHGEFAAAGGLWGTVVGLTRESLDTVPPVTTASLAPPANGAGWNNSSVTVTLNATDNQSGVRSITYSASGAQTIAPTTVLAASTSFTVSGEGVTNLSYFATDNASNVESPHLLAISIDTVAPSVFCASPDGMWHATNVTIGCSASDGNSGLASPAQASIQLSTSVPAGTETASAFTNAVAVCDVAGNCAAAGPVGPIMVDRKAPTITISAPASGGVYTLNQAVPASYGCTDGGSGVATCSGNVANGSNFDTSTAGVHTFTVNASDQVGNTSTQSVTYVVGYAICPLFDQTKPHNSGSTVAVRIELCDANGNDVSSASITVHADNITPGGTVPSSPSNPGNFFTFDSKLGTSGGYVYNLRTGGLASGTYNLNFTVAGDPTPHSVQFVIS